MRSVLAAIEPDACAQAVLGTAIALADLFDATPIALHVRENGTSSPSAAAHAAGVELRETAGNATEQIVGAAHDPDVAALVLGARGMHGGPRPAGRTALDVITRVGKPVAVVPPQARAPERVTHILIPLEGTIESSHALEQTVKLAHQHQLEIIVLHVHSPATVPAFSDHEPHGTQAWEQEFLARYIATPHERDQARSPTRCSRRRRGRGSSRDSGRPARARLESEPQSGPRPRRLRDPRAQPRPGTADTRGLTLARARCG